MQTSEPTVPTAAAPSASAATPAVRTAGTVPRSARLAILLGALAFLPAATTDMYLPSLPDVARDLGTTSAAAQLTISCVLIGGALSQLFMGPLSDRHGRRRPAVLGLSAYVVVALLCVVAGSIGQLVALRVLQGVVGASASVVAMAVIGDRYSGAEAARLMSKLWIAIAVAPILAPLAGTFVAERWGWRAVFTALALLGAVLAVAVARSLPETLPPDRRIQHGFTASLGGYRDLLHDRQFLSLALLPGLGLAVIMSYVTGSPFVLQGEYGLTAQQFALLFGLGATSMVVGSQVNASLVRRVGPVRLLRVGLPATVLSTAVLLAVAATHAGGVVGLIVPLWFTVALLASVIANASALALSRHPERSGTAAAVIGCLQGALGGAVSPLVGLLGGTGVAMAGVMLAAAAAGVLVLALGTPAYRADGQAALSTVARTP
ncbi:multidrug effflux MFS transporter [uncultured Cellulomonas sp.]|uniref:multidrug effflux MFS transporter n=1 Tax=uncultured Cellulomonas sp. TaxID=189682 RepID=UPI00262618E0|nr:multidrug effflux MFS transporter [uncultured Cellulomonas sp.]